MKNGAAMVRGVRVCTSCMCVGADGVSDSACDLLCSAVVVHVERYEAVPNRAALNAVQRLCEVR